MVQREFCVVVAVATTAVFIISIFIIIIIGFYYYCYYRQHICCYMLSSLFIIIHIYIFLYIFFPQLSSLLYYTSLLQALMNQAVTYKSSRNQSRSRANTGTDEKLHSLLMVSAFSLTFFTFPCKDKRLACNLTPFPN